MELKSPIVFLGFCERASYVRDGNTNLFKWNVVGLKHIILSPFYPLLLDGWNIGIALNRVAEEGDISIKIIDDYGIEIGKIDLKTESTTADTETTLLSGEKTSFLSPEHGWTTIFLPLEKTQIVISKPGTYFLKLHTDKGPIVIGQIYFAVVNPPPLTPERIAAIRSDPSAVKAVRIEIGCRKCSTKLKAYAGLERIQKQEDEGYIFYQEIPDEFRCECGSTTIDLRLVRKHLYAPLGQPMSESEQFDFVPLYEQSAVESIRSMFARLLSSAPREESLQKFIQDNPILLHQFPAERIFFKPPILTSFKADFAIVTPQKELILIELETTTTRLMKKDGGVAAPLQHAFDQIQSWLQVVDDHRLAVLDSLKLDRNFVSTIRGVVIAGRDIGYDARQLRRLKGIDRGRVTFLTYDDLLFGLAALLRRLTRL